MFPHQGHTEKLLEAADRFSTIKQFITGSHHAMRMAALSNSRDTSLDLSRITKIIPVGTNVSKDVFNKLKTIFPSLESVPNYYGMTEFGSKLSYKLCQ